jgi:hypothetical protein
VLDVSANVLINDKFTIGAAWFEDAVSALVGFSFLR